MAGRTVVVGIGNPARGDDGVGTMIAEKLMIDEGIDRHRVLVIDAGSVPENYLEPIIRELPRQVVLIDACNFGAVPGEFRFFNPEELAHLQLKGFSTHTLPLNTLATVITQETLSPVWLFGIQPARTGLGETLSSPVSAAVPRALGFLRGWLAVKG